MTTPRERELLERWLRSEAARLGVALEPPEERVYAPMVQYRRLCRRATPAEIAEMRALRARGVRVQAIVDRMGFSDQTIRRHTKGETG